MEMLNRLILLFIFISSSVFSQSTLFVDCDGTPSPENWLGDGFCDDGSYTWNGMPINFNCEEFGYDSGDCEIPLPEGVYGCTNPISPNFNPWAEYDDNSCTGISCSDGEAKIILEITLDQYPSETSWSLTDLSNDQTIESVTAGDYSYDQANQTIVYDLCVPETGVELTLSDTYGDGLEGSLYGGTNGNFVILGDLEPCGTLDTLWVLEDAAFGSNVYSSSIWLQQCDIPVVEGCTNNAYIEFNPLAAEDDGSCSTLHTVGCVDPFAFNYDSTATLNYIVPTCDYSLIIGDAGGDGWGESYLGLMQDGEPIGEYSISSGVYFDTIPIELSTSSPIHIYYFEVGSTQQSQEELEFQTMHNSFKLINSNDVITLQGGEYPFANNGQGALQPFQPPFWNVYSGLPYCGDYCEPVIYGCIYPTNEANPDIVMFNYNPEANTYDPNIEPCIPEIEGCTDASMYGYNSEANVDDGSCVPWFIGCTDSLAWNYNLLANLSNPESCLYFGCMDSLADNYNPTANVELEGTCFTTILGCTDPEAFNYNPEANTEDFSCVPIMYGCMDSLAFNYDSLANISNDACIEVVVGCMDPFAHNYDAVSNTDDGSCLYDAGCIGEPGDPYWLNDTCYAWVIVVDPYCCNSNWDDKCQELYWLCEFDSPLNIDELMEDNSIILYPNPTEDIINITSEESFELQVFDVLGSRVIYWKVESNGSPKTIKVNMSPLEDGIYNFNIRYNGRILNKKIIKQ